MSVNSLKTQAGQSIATIATIKLDACRHATAQSVADGAISVSSSLGAGATGSITITGGNATAFTNSSPFLLWGSELIEVTVTSNVQVEVVARGRFGTADTAHSPSSAILKHIGEVDGSCYGFPQTCNSGDSYLAGLYRDFKFPSVQLDWSVIYFNGFESWSHTPAKVDPGQTMGSRARAGISLLDHVEGDTYVPYSDRRTSKGTLWTKLLERHPNIEGRPLIIETGFDPLNYDASNFIKREYIIDSLNIKDGAVSIAALDPLILTDDKTAKAPVASKGTLSAIVNDASTTITFTSAPAFDYAASGTVFVRIDSEVIECTVLSDFVLTIVNRAIGGTDKKDHKVNSTVQKVLFYDNVNAVSIIEDLITNYTPISAAVIDNYADVIAATSSITLTAYITKPTSIKTLINELVKNADLVMYYDEEKQKIRIKQVSDATQTPIFINEDDHIERGSANFTRRPKDQFTRYTTAWAANNITKTTDDENFSIVYQAVNLSKELPRAKGEANEKKIFFNRWLTSASEDVTIGTSIAQRVLDRVSEMPYDLSVNLDIESVFSTQGGVLENGSIATIASSKRVNADGSKQSKNYQVLSMKDLGNMKYKVDFQLFQDPLSGVNIDFTISTNKENYDLSTEYSPATGNYTILIEQGVTIGSTSTAIAAFTTGAQAAGVTFDFIIRGGIEGAGGAGGAGGILNAIDSLGEAVFGGAGLVGGNAFNATVNCTINTGSGAVWAGGGGVNGGTSYTKRLNPSNPSTLVAYPGNGGSGGQGYIGGLAAIKGEVTGLLTASGVDGNDGSKGAPGVLGSISAGEFGEDSDLDTSEFGQSAAGPAGFAIVSNGNNVTISAGDNPINIRGRKS